MTRKDLYAKMEQKYLAGAIEHGGNLNDLSALEMAENLLEEAIDSVFYAEALVNKLKEV